jgi:response regulator NasT
VIGDNRSMNLSIGSQGRILVVDDDRLVLATVAHGLAQAGYEVIDADNGDDAILLAREHRPELALLDIRMEGKSGFDVAETLRDAYRIPFMFLSAFADEATLAKVEALGALDYLVKPLDVGQILPRVADALGRARAGRSGAGPLAASSAARVASLPGAAGGASASTTDAVLEPVALAIGVLMHRHALLRGAAYQRLQRLAAEQGLALSAQAERLLDAVEELARSGG